MRYLERNIDVELQEWSKHDHHKPLLLRGVRQVGQTSFLAAKNLSKGIRTSLENFSAYDDILVYPLYAVSNFV